MTKLPRLLDADLQEITPLRPLKYSLMDKLAPLSTAKLTVEANSGVRMRDFVELYTSGGSAGIYRVNNLRREGCELYNLSLQHGLCTLSDHMHPGESTESGSCHTLLTKILSNQTRWVLGTVEVPDDKDLTWECNNTNDLQGLLAVMKELPEYYLDFDQTQRPWVLHVLAKPTEVACECRFDRNLSKDIQIEYDDADMCTLAYADGLDAPIEADTIGTWGEIARPVNVDEALGADLIEETIHRYLEQTKEPRATITLPALELSRLTGEPFDSFRKGQLCRCILPDMTVVQRIESIERPDPIGEPDYVVLTLASTQNDLSVTVAGMVVDIRHVNQLYQQLDKNLRIEAETIDILADEILLKATKEEVDIVSERISTAEILLNETIGQLELKVDYNDYQSDIKEVTLRLDAAEGTLTAQADEIYLKADKTYVDNLVAKCASVEDLEAVQSWSTDFAAVSVSASSIVGGYGDFDALWCGQLNGGAAATQEWVQEQEYVKKTDITKESKRFITSVSVLEDADGIYGISTDSDVIYYYT